MDGHDRYGPALRGSQQWRSLVARRTIDIKDARATELISEAGLRRWVKQINHTHTETRPCKSGKIKKLPRITEYERTQYFGFNLHTFPKRTVCKALVFAISVHIRDDV